MNFICLCCKCIGFSCHPIIKPSSKRYEKILELRDEAGMGPPIIGAMPLVSIDGTREAAQARVNVPPCSRIGASGSSKRCWFDPERTSTLEASRTSSSSVTRPKVQ